MGTSQTCVKAEMVRIRVHLHVRRGRLRVRVDVHKAERIEQDHRRLLLWDLQHLEFEKDGGSGGIGARRVSGSKIEFPRRKSRRNRKKWDYGGVSGCGGRLSEWKMVRMKKCLSANEPGTLVTGIFGKYANSPCHVTVEEHFARVL